MFLSVKGQQKNGQGSKHTLLEQGTRALDFWVRAGLCWPCHGKQRPTFPVN